MNANITITNIESIIRTNAENQASMKMIKSSVSKGAVISKVSLRGASTARTVRVYLELLGTKLFHTLKLQ
jgi:hypothetical protein